MEITTVTFQPNENRQCFDIEILNDQLDEGTESFSADILSVPSDSGVVITNPDSTIISITDDDGKIEKIIILTYTVIAVCCCHYSQVTNPIATKQQV